MHFLYIHPDDRQRLLTWTRRNLVAFALLLSVLTAVNQFTVKPTQGSPQQTGRSSVVADVLEEDSQIEFAETDAHLPTGWRRTADGWEHTSQWYPFGRSNDQHWERTLGQWIEQQKTREPWWIQSTLNALRETPPLAYAVLQVTAIALVVSITSKSTATSTKPVRH